ncbi:hypothetical protein [Fructilactobacillus cliffordii]|uniref:Cell division protein FtsL n=1 Tax=Fructilactobacillus cliffordii TaxID=2940299 RepID=A0A9Q9E360_9LACO|nr:hypothetical protein [Fructilactobacillus cliffordii]USS86388.1 hypothetical protein M3M38_06905 [Fructilactobacillus cliffordii]USS89452.1 hypothetical protein M3M40_01310 [Fructilactobacillus cliffordii]
MAQNGLAERQRQTSLNQNSRTSRHQQLGGQPVPHLRLSAFEKTIMVTGVCLLVLLMITVVSAKNQLNHSQRTLQNVTTKSSRMNRQNQSYRQELDAKEVKAINHVVKQDKLSIADSDVRNVTR